MCNTKYPDSTSNPQNYILCLWNGGDHLGIFDVIAGVRQTGHYDAYVSPNNSVITISLSGNDVSFYVTNGTTGITSLFHRTITNVLTGNIHGLYCPGGTGGIGWVNVNPIFDNFVVYPTGNGGEYES
jgi:hypothetical protein